MLRATPVEEFDTEQQHLTTYNRYAILLLAACLVGFALFKLLNFTLSDIGVSPSLILLIGAPLALFLAYLQIELTLIIFIYAIPVVTYEIPGLPFYFTFADALLIVLVIVWFSRAVLKKEYKLYKTFLDRHLFVFIMLSIMSVINSRSLSAGAFEIVQTLEFLAFSFYFFCTVAKKREVITAIFQALTFSGAFFSLHGILQYFSVHASGFRAYSMMGHFNAFGAYVAMMMLITFNLMLKERSRMMRWVYMGVLGVDLIAVMLTYSRGAWIALVVGVMVSAWLRGLTQFVKIFTVMTLFLIMLSMVVPSRFIGRAASITEVEDKTSRGRLRQYNIAAETMMRYPLLGVGITSMEDYVTQEYDWAGAGRIHNLFLWVGAERGVPAMLSLLAIFGVFFLKTKAKLEETDDETVRAQYIALFTSILAFFIINLTALQLVRGLGLLLGMFLGLFQAIAKLEEEKEEEMETPYYIGRAAFITRR